MPTKTRYLTEAQLTLWLAALGAVAGLGCGVTPLPYTSPMAGNYCPDFLHFAHACASWATAGFLVCLCITVVAGFLAAQLNNGGTSDSFFKKNQSTFLFAFAVLSGIFGAYLHSRAEAASSAAAEVEVAMMNRDSGKRYNMCLGAASRWDASLSKALDAANAAVPNTEASGTYQLADAVEKSGEARGRVIHATENQGQVLATLLDVMEAIPQAKMPKPLKEKLAAARAKLEEMKSTLGDAKNISNDTTDLVVKAKKTLQSGEQEQGPAPAEPKAVSPHDSKGL
jgi:hypothetical protein